MESQIKRYREYRRTMDEAPDALQRFLAPFMERLTEKSLSNAVELMNEAERAELDRLLGVVDDGGRHGVPACAGSVQERPFRA
ncbi:hypothetical protein [Streptomyces similanensis]|uniref:Uncharacterized protein n=1 Tax=Streptomyces similanensis TaxID=1274988 RepID=A0ABP9KIU0_9ACTN